MRQLDLTVFLTRACRISPRLNIDIGMKARGFFIQFLCTVALAAPLTAAANDNEIPLEVIGALPDFANPRLSPNGEWVAVQMVDGGESVLVVQRFLTGEGEQPAPTLLRFGDKNVAWYAWANDERLVVGIRNTRGAGNRIINTVDMATIRRDGTDKHRIRMVGNTRAKGMAQATPLNYAYVVNWLEDDPDHILAALSNEPGEWNEPRVHKVNVNTGKRELVQRNDKGFYYWVADEAGDIRVGARVRVNLGRSDVEMFYRATKGESWEKLQDADYFDNDRIMPYRFDRDDPNILLVTTRELSREELEVDELSGLYRYDLNQRKIVGPYVNTDYKRLVDTVAKAFPAEEVQLVSHSRDLSRSFFRVYSDTRSPEYYLLDTKAKRLDYIAAEYPRLADYTLAPMQTVSYTARDGLAIPAYLTAPVTAEDGPLPLVVMPHGGPWAHDSWGFNSYVQLMANRGYLVLQPQFRGSTGYGVAHEEAGYGQWGKAIQDDITDGVRWLIKTGRADPDRVCIMGASFGGYAAAMGLVRTPDLYACGVSINGVLDLEQLFDDELGFSSINRRMFNSRKEVATTSPLEQTKAITAPLLIVGSKKDSVVPVKHSQRMYKKLRKTQPETLYLELPDGEHWRTNEPSELAMLSAVDEFLGRYLSSARKPMN